MKRTNKNDGCPVKTTLSLKRLSPTTWIDQHGRVLQVYTNRDGKLDLKPVGVGYRK